MDADAAALLAEFARRPRPDAPDTATYLRTLRLGYRALAALAGPVEEVETIQDLTLSSPGGPLPARLYLPARPPGGAFLAWFHGGGFVSGDLETHDRTLRALANRAGVPVLAVAYRLAPEHPYPAGLEDCEAALLWAGANAAAYDADPARLLVGGDSAGGALAAAAAMRARDHGRPPLAGQILLYPDGDARPGYHHASWREHDGVVLSRGPKDRQLDMYLPAHEDRRHPQISPALAPDDALRGLPPALIITAGFDPQRDEGELYAARLAEAGVPVHLTRYPGTIHGFAQMAGRLAAGGQVIAEIAAACRDGLPPPNLQ